MSTVVHVGCGDQRVPAAEFPPEQWQEIRVDLDPETTPDIVADLRHVPLPDGTADAVYCAHVLEHLPETDLPVVFGELRRLLTDGGELVLMVPNLEVAAQWIVEGRACEAMYHAQGKTEPYPVRPLDLVYGSASTLTKHPLMAHRTGFTTGTLAWWLTHAGFEGTIYCTDFRLGYSLVARARKVNGSRLNGTGPDECVILVQQGEPMETQPDPVPEPTESSSELSAPTSGAGVGDSAEVSIIDPEDQ